MHVHGGGRCRRGHNGLIVIDQHGSWLGTIKVGVWVEVEGHTTQVGGGSNVQQDFLNVNTNGQHEVVRLGQGHVECAAPTWGGV